MKTRMFTAGLICTAIIASTVQADGDSAAVFDPARGIWDLDSLATLRPLVQAGYFSSYDRRGANDDGFEGTWSSLYQLPTGEHAIVDLRGPGCLYTLWFTGPDGGYSLPWGKIRFYLDDDPKPRVEADGTALFSGDVEGFPQPLVANSFISTGGNVSHVPIPFEKRLLITTEGRAGFYNAYYHLYPPGTVVKSWTGPEDLSRAVNAWNAAGSHPHRSSAVERICGRVSIEGGRNAEKLVELASIDGPGVIQGVRINPSGPLSAFVLNNTWLRIWWDGEESPSVDVPLGPFFGSGLGEASVRSLPIGMSPSGTYYCDIRMPFRKSARLALESRHHEPVGEVYCELDVSRSAEDRQGGPAMQFRARWNREWPASKGRDFLILDEAGGQGVYLGHTLIVEPYSPDNKQWWEGDLRIWTDHRRHPILQGTGHEDELLGGWSSRWLRGPYSLPLHGLPAVKLFAERADSQWNGAMSGYRFFAGGIPYRDGIRVSTEHGMNNVVVTNYAAVAYYYHSPAAGMVLSDAIDIADDEARRAHEYVASGGKACELAGQYDAEEAFGAAGLFMRKGMRGQAVESFMLEIDKRNAGVLLRRVYHQSAGKHAAKLFVDGKPVQLVASPESFQLDRWREQDIVLPASVTKGHDRLDIRFETIEGEWNSFGYSAWSVGEPEK